MIFVNSWRIWRLRHLGWLNWLSLHFTHWFEFVSPISPHIILMLLKFFRFVNCDFLLKALPSDNYWILLGFLIFLHLIFHGLDPLFKCFVCHRRVAAVCQGWERPMGPCRGQFFRCLWQGHGFGYFQSRFEVQYVLWCVKGVILVILFNVIF